MDIQGYISSGILEAYIMSLATSQEVMEVESLAVKFPAIRIELGKIENAILEFAELNSKTPPPALRDKILAAIAADENASKQSEGKIIDFNTAGSRKSSSSLKGYAIAASLALLVCLGYMFKEHEKVRMEKLALQQSIDSLSSATSTLQKQFADDKRDLLKSMDVFTAPGNKMIELKGLDISPTSFAMVLYNQQSKEAFISVKSLPAPPADKQYQLWAIVDGKPVDMGVFEINATSSAMQKMKTIENPQAFAVTLEQKGGSPTPTLEQMYVMGKNG